jgi:catechol 2,3-dioxygenase-like lactoylglutathione lyase family enzyme
MRGMEIAKLVPELYVSDIRASLAFYVGLLGFVVMFERVEERFAYLQREGAQIMMEQSTGRVWLAGPLEAPYGRGVSFQIEAADVDSLYASVQASDAKIFMAMEEKWYRIGDVEAGNRQFIVQDPDGYLLRFYRDLGTR